MSEVRIWTGEKPTPTYFVDVLYPKKSEPGTIRLVLRNQQGRSIENLLDIIPEVGIQLLPLSEEAQEHFPCRPTGELIVVNTVYDVDVEEAIKEGSAPPPPPTEKIEGKLTQAVIERKEKEVGERAGVVQARKLAESSNAGIIHREPTIPPEDSKVPADCLV